jgi:hypothetical protein
MKNVFKPFPGKAGVEHRINLENLRTADVWRHTFIIPIYLVKIGQLALFGDPD